jgi:hypothetical protein
MSIDLYEELHALAAAFDTQATPYALCGGLAVALHGAPRFTKDIDVLVALEHVNEARSVVRACGFNLTALPITFKDSGLQVHRLSKIVEGSLLTVDLVCADENLQPVLDSRERVRTEHGELWVVSREGLISMKLAAGRPLDLHDVEQLAGS